MVLSVPLYTAGKRLGSPLGIPSIRVNLNADRPITVSCESFESVFLTETTRTGQDETRPNFVETGLAGKAFVFEH